MVEPLIKIRITLRETPIRWRLQRLLMTTSQSDADSLAAPPGPNGLPLLGTTVSVMRQPFGFYEDIAAYGDVVQYRTLLGTFTALFHPDHVERVLLQEPDRFEQADIADFDVGLDPEGLVDVRGDQWHRQRTLMQPAFTMDRIQSYADAMVDVTTDTITEWMDGDTITLEEAFSSLTLRILTRSLFDLNLKSDDADVIARTAAVLNEQLAVGNLSVLLPSWVPTPSNRRFKRTYSAFVDRVDDMIAERRRHDDPGDDLLSILLTAQTDDGATLTEKELRDNMLTFLFAGHETTSLGLTYTVMLLAQHDEALERVRAEHQEVIGADDPSFAHVSRLTHTKRVIDEALRLYPPVPILFRQPTEPASFDGYQVGAESIVTLPQFHIHRDERFWDDPKAFDPERWRDERAAERPEYAYFPFGGGPRHCIGMRFARLEMQLVLAVLLRRFDFELVSDPDLDFDPGMTLRPAEPVRARIHER